MSTLDISSEMMVKWRERKEIILIVLLGIFYGVGIAGILLPIHKDFILLTPFNLLLSLSLVLANHTGQLVKTIWLLFICYLWGWFIEMLGVNTGLIFGSYEYGEVLGPKIWGTPLMIGVNWALLIYCAGCWTNWLLTGLHWLAKALFTAVLMVLLDLLIEPVAIHYSFWTWENEVIPTQNYIAWFFVALPLAGLFILLFPKTTNIVARALFIFQVLFFLILGIAN